LSDFLAKGRTGEGSDLIGGFKLLTFLGMPGNGRKKQRSAASKWEGMNGEKRMFLASWKGSFWAVGQRTAFLSGKLGGCEKRNARGGIVSVVNDCAKTFVRGKARRCLSKRGSSDLQRIWKGGECF